MSEDDRLLGRIEGFMEADIQWKQDFQRQNNRYQQMMDERVAKIEEERLPPLEKAHSEQKGAWKTILAAGSVGGAIVAVWQLFTGAR